MSRYKQAETLNTIIRVLINKKNVTIKPIPSEPFAPAETAILINGLYYCMLTSHDNIGYIISMMQSIDYIAGGI